ncbi:hypothetical protein HYFRA_00008672 [Hymenoscyphus fraxineus]|uniref:Uncharacterized protein n=1 Tax=Hymenoscyphus fraxineus TaxID=746836 RepID=A0A9N9PTW9_9HELO|nr:hypothetical protein HYFRA_00008672 [Hymenoscyphus fraxineus]
MVAQSSGPLQGWDLDDPEQCRSLVVALEFAIMGVPNRNSTVFRQLNDHQYTSLERLAHEIQRSTDVREFVTEFLTFEQNRNQNDAQLVNAAYIMTENLIDFNRIIQHQPGLAATSAARLPARHSLPPRPTPKEKHANSTSQKDSDDESDQDADIPNTNLYLPLGAQRDPRETALGGFVVSNMATSPQESIPVAPRGNLGGPGVNPLREGSGAQDLGPRHLLPPISAVPAPIGISFAETSDVPGAQVLSTPLNRERFGRPAPQSDPGRMGNRSRPRPIAPRPGPAPPVGGLRANPRQARKRAAEDDYEDEDEYDDEPSMNDHASSLSMKKKAGDKAKHKPRKRRGAEPLDEHLDKTNAVLHQPDPTKLKLHFHTRHTNKKTGEVTVELVKNKYRHKVDWSSREHIKKLNAWRSQILSRNFRIEKKKREYWLVSEQANVMNLIYQQLQSRPTLRWAKLANDYNRQFHETIQPAGSRLLNTAKRVNNTISQDRQTPWRTRASIEHAAWKWPQYQAVAAKSKARQDAQAGTDDDANASSDGNETDTWSDDESELPDPSQKQVATPESGSSTKPTSGNKRKKPPGRPMKKPIDFNRAKSTSTVSDESSSEYDTDCDETSEDDEPVDNEPAPKRQKANPKTPAKATPKAASKATPKAASKATPKATPKVTPKAAPKSTPKGNPKGGKKGGKDDDDGPTFPGLSKKPAP